jgi:hypothetical protein
VHVAHRELPKLTTEPHHHPPTSQSPVPASERSPELNWILPRHPWLPISQGVRAHCFSSSEHNTLHRFFITSSLHAVARFCLTPVLRLISSILSTCVVQLPCEMAFGTALAMPTIRGLGHHHHCNDDDTEPFPQVPSIEVMGAPSSPTSQAGSRRRERDTGFPEPFNDGMFLTL